MSEEMKLLMALCDALGFDVEKISTPRAEAYMGQGLHGPLYDAAIDPYISYKLTPKQEG